MHTQKIIASYQTHGTNIVAIVTGEENLSDCDGLVTTKSEFALQISTADCAPICFFDGNTFGILHAGWRGLVDGIVEKMILYFDPSDLVCHLGPCLESFEIQKDHCYDRVLAHCGEKYLVHNQDKIFFSFRGAILGKLKKYRVSYDERSTFHTPELASWRRDKIKEATEKTRNRTIIRRDTAHAVRIKTFGPSEVITLHF